MSAKGKSVGTLCGALLLAGLATWAYLSLTHSIASPSYQGVIQDADCGAGGRLRRIVLAKVEVEGKPLRECFDWLIAEINRIEGKPEWEWGQHVSLAQDVFHAGPIEGINPDRIIHLPPLTQLTAFEALREMADLAEGECFLSETRVSIRPRNEIHVKSFGVKHPSVFFGSAIASATTKMDVRARLEAYGIEFPLEGGASYDPATQTMTLRSAAIQIELANLFQSSICVMPELTAWERFTGYFAAQWHRLFPAPSPPIAPPVTPPIASPIAPLGAPSIDPFGAPPAQVPHP